MRQKVRFQRMCKNKFSGYVHHHNKWKYAQDREVDTSKLKVYLTYKNKRTKCKIKGIKNPPLKVSYDQKYKILLPVDRKVLDVTKDYFQIDVFYNGKVVKKELFNTDNKVCTD